VVSFLSNHTVVVAVDWYIGSANTVEQAIVAAADALKL
jgi:hypothetical protein